MIHTSFDWMLTKRDKMYQTKHLMRSNYFVTSRTINMAWQDLTVKSKFSDF